MSGPVVYTTSSGNVVVTTSRPTQQSTGTATMSTSRIEEDGDGAASQTTNAAGPARTAAAGAVMGLGAFGVAMGLL
jgi:hypothetical protein